jgi:hypothetical protein
MAGPGQSVVEAAARSAGSELTTLQRATAQFKRPAERTEAVSCVPGRATRSICVRVSPIVSTRSSALAVVQVEALSVGRSPACRSSGAAILACPL